MLVVLYDVYGGSWWLFNVLVKKGYFGLIIVDFMDLCLLVDVLV